MLSVVIELNAIAAFICSWTIGQVHLLVYYIKAKSCLLTLFWHVRSSVITPHIDARCAQNEASVIREHGVCFKKILTPVVHPGTLNARV